MKTEKIKIGLWALYSIVLLLFLYSMIHGQEKIFNEGTAYKFKCAVVDPNDPFRGKFVRLAFEPIRIESVPGEISTSPYLGVVEVDNNGYAYISRLASENDKGEVSIELEIDPLDTTFSFFLLPFDRLYMNEHKAQLAEDLYRDALADSTRSVYAQVFIADGRYLLDDVYVDGVRLKDMIE